MQAAFREHHGLQCGYCTPGMVMAAVGAARRSTATLDRGRRCASGSRATSAAAPATTTSWPAVIAGVEPMTAGNRVIPATFAYARRRLGRRGDRAARRARRRRQAPRRRPLAAAAHEAAARDARGARRRRPPRATSPTSATRATSSPIGGLTRHHDVEHTDAPRRARAAPGGRRGRGRRPAGAPPRHARRVAGARRPGVGPARGGARARRHASWSAGSGGERAIAADDFFLDFLETALAPDEMITEVRVPKTNGAGWAFEKFNRRAQDWAIVGVAAVSGDDPGVALVNMGSTPVRADAVEAALRDRCVGRGRRRGRRRRGHRSAVRPQRLARVPPPPGTGARRRRRAHRAPSQGGRPMTATTFGAGSLVGVARAAGRRPRRCSRGEAPTSTTSHVDGVLHLAFVRSPVAHAEIRGIDTSDARAMPGVVAVYTADDLDVPEHTGMMQLNPAVVRPRSRSGKVRFVGDTVAVVVAETQGAGGRRGRGRDRRLRPAARGRRHRARARARTRRCCSTSSAPTSSAGGSATTATRSTTPTSIVRGALREPAGRGRARWRARRSRSSRATTATVTSSPCTSPARCRT